MSHPLTGWIRLKTRTGRKQAQDPPGSLHIVVSSVEWSSLKGRGPRWFTVRKPTCFSNATCLCHSLWRSDFTVCNREQAQDPLGSLHIVVSSVEWSSLKGRGPRWFTVRTTTCFTKTPHILSVWHGVDPPPLPHPSPPLHPPSLTPTPSPTKRNGMYLSKGKILFRELGSCVKVGMAVLL